MKAGSLTGKITVLSRRRDHLLRQIEGRQGSDTAIMFMETEVEALRIAIGLLEQANSRDTGGPLSTLREIVQTAPMDERTRRRAHDALDRLAGQ